MKTARRPSILFTTITALTFAACGGGAGATTGPGGPTAATGGSPTSAPTTVGDTPTRAPDVGETVDACALITAADIDDVTGLVANTMEPGPQAGVFPAGCYWELIDDSAMVPPSISLGILATGGLDYYDRYFRPFNEGAGYEPIEGLGDEAVDADFGAVLVVSGDALFQVQYVGGGFGGDDSTALATELARKVVANLANR